MAVAAGERDAAALRRALRERYDRPRARRADLAARAAAEHEARDGCVKADVEAESARAALKRDFIELSTQQEVLALLLEARGGMPTVAADVRLGDLAALEAELAERKAAKKEAKAAATEARARVETLIEEVSAAHGEYESERDALLVAIDALETAQREREAARAAMPSPPTVAVTASGRAEIERDAADAETEARALTAAIGADENEIAALEAQIAPLQGELVELRATIDADEAAAATEEQLGLRKARSREMHAWYTQMAALVATLGGAELVDPAEAEDDSLVLRVTTHAVAGTAAPQNHELSLKFAPGGAELAGATLSPADVLIDDLVELAKRDANGLAFLLREVKARVAAHAAA